jgi:hypothetical protein
VNSLRTFRWSIAVLLLLTVAWKLAVRPDSQDYLTENLVSFFVRNRFDVLVSDEMVNYMPIVRASSAACDLQIARLTPDASNRDLIRHLTVGTDRSFVVFRGEVYAHQPIPWTVLNYLWSRFLRELGLTRHVTPIFAVTSNTSCNAESLPWHELQDIR